MPTLARQPGILTPGLCIVADRLSVHEAYELAHNRPSIENIKVRLKSYLNGSADDTAHLRDGDFHVFCDTKFDFSGDDEVDDFLELFRRGGVLPDAIGYSRAVRKKYLLELVGRILAGELAPHTIVLNAVLPEEGLIQTQRIPVLRERIDLAFKLSQLGGRIAIYGAAADFADLNLPDGVLSIGAGIREKDEVLWGRCTLETARKVGVHIPLIGSVMGATGEARVEYLDTNAPVS